MKMLIFKVICFLALFTFMQCAILPWLISNDSMPFWVDIVFITLVLMLWLIVIDRLAHQILKILRKKDDATRRD